MASTINAKNTSTGLVMTPDATGQLELQTADVTRLTIDSSGNVIQASGNYFIGNGSGFGWGDLTTYIGGTSVSDFINFNTNGSERMRIDSSGNVGIGTSSPNQRLQIYSSGATGGAIQVTNASTGASSTDGVLIGYDGSNDVIINNQEATQTKIFTSGTERMRIDSGGGVFIGKTTTAETTAGWYFSPGSGNVGLSSGNYFVINYVPGGASTMIDFRTGGVSKGSISQNGTNTAYNTSSDYRLKENIVDLSNALETISKLKPRQFDWKENGETTTGFIAHELQAVVPDCVTGEKDAVDSEGNPVYQGVDTSFLVATLTAAIKELKAELDTVKAELAELKGVA